MDQNNSCKCGNKLCGCKTTTEPQTDIFKSYFTVYSNESNIRFLDENNDPILKNIHNSIKEFSIYNEGEQTVFECMIYIDNNMNQFNVEDLLKIRKVLVNVGPGVNNSNGPASVFFNYKKEVKEISFKLQSDKLNNTPVIINLKIK